MNSSNTEATLKLTYYFHYFVKMKQINAMLIESGLGGAGTRLGLSTTA